MNFVLCISVMVYIFVAICVFRLMYNVNEDLKQRKHYDKHPERYGVIPVWAISIISVLWPIQLIGLLILIFRGGRM